MRNNFKKCIVTSFYVFLWLGRVYTIKGPWVAAEHTTPLISKLC